MKKLLGIVVLGLFFSANFLAIDLKAEVVTDPDLIKELSELVEEKKKTQPEGTRGCGRLEVGNNAL